MLSMLTARNLSRRQSAHHYRCRYLEAFHTSGSTLGKQLKDTFTIDLLSTQHKLRVLAEAIDNCQNVERNGLRENELKFCPEYDMPHGKQEVKRRGEACAPVHKADEPPNDQPDRILPVKCAANNYVLVHRKWFPQWTTPWLPSRSTQDACHS